MLLPRIGKTLDLFGTDIANFMAIGIFIYVMYLWPRIPSGNYISSISNLSVK